MFILRCQQRSRDWLTERQLFSSGLHVCPLNAKVMPLKFSGKINLRKNNNYCGGHMLQIFFFFFFFSVRYLHQT